MNENINLAEILKDCPKGMKLYTPIAGEVEFDKIDNNGEFPIRTHSYVNKNKEIISFTQKGLYLNFPNGKCLLFPSKDQRDWSKWECPKPKKPKFDPKTLKPFDKVLCRQDSSKWHCNMFSHMYFDWKKVDYPFHCFSNTFMYAIPYNEETKHLVGTYDEAPEYYRYWED